MRFQSVSLKLLLCALTASCSEITPVARVRETYSCCEPGCLNDEHLTSAETFNAGGLLIRRLEYHSSQPGRIARSVKYVYRENRLHELRDSGEFHFVRTEYRYENGTLSTATTFDSHATVYNEIMDTIPHTQWGMQYDTTVVHFTFDQGRLVRRMQEWNGDTLSLAEFIYDDRNRLIEQNESTGRRRFYYNEWDSVSRVELMSLSVSGANVSSTIPRWEVHGYIEIHYDSVGRRIAEATFDYLDIEMHRVLYSYDGQGKLVSQRWGSACDSVVYRR